MTSLDRRVADLLRLHEGLRLKPYLDTVGKLTIGHGRNLTDRGITEDEAALLLANDLAEAWQGLVARASWVRDLDPVRQAVLIDMAVNLGLDGLLKFRRTLASVQSGRYVDAARQMLESQWAGQVGSRATRLAQMMRFGQWPPEVSR